MEKRALLAVILSILVIFLFQVYVSPPKQPLAPPKENQEKHVPSAQEDSYSTKKEPIPSADSLTLEDTVEDSKPSRSTSSDPGQDITVDTRLYKAVFTTRGALLKSFILKDYLAEQNNGGKPVEMVTGQEPGTYPLSLTLLGKQPAKTESLLFDVDRIALDLTAYDGAEQMIFTSVLKDGVRVKKILTFFPDNYLVGINIEISGNSGSPPYDGAMVNWVRVLNAEKDGSSRLGFTGPAAYSEGKLHEVKLKSLDKEAVTFAQDVSWAGYEEKYFMASFIKRNKSDVLTAKLARYGNAVVVSSYDRWESGAPSGELLYAASLFCGPKDIDILKPLGMNLEKAIHFGMFDIIAKPLLYALKYINKITHNYGLAIIIITVFLKVIFFPLTHKSYKSMKSLKDLQPQMEALRKKYKGDRERLNMETINLYRSYKVNPLGGCLPLLVQFPIFIAFYWVLMGSIELRHSPFVFWIKDLSAHDPYYITPILMGASMFIQQKMTPTAADPTQAKVMLAMPIVFTAMFLNFPAGLVIYWLVNNVLQIFQQLYIDKRIS